VNGGDVESFFLPQLHAIEVILRGAFTSPKPFDSNSERSP
jgi:hypothetical protein